MKHLTLVLFGLLAASALVTSDFTEDFVRQVVAPTACEGESGTASFVALEIENCPSDPAQACFALGDSRVGFNVRFEPSSQPAENWYTLTAYVESMTEGLRQVSFRYIEAEAIRDTVNLGLVGFLKFDTPEEIEDAVTHFVVESSNGVEVCQKYTIKVLNHGKTYDGAQVGDACSVAGIPCAFANSICGSNLRCSCDAESKTDFASLLCKKSVSFACTSNTDCSALSTCDRTGSGKACRCSTNTFWSNGACRALDGVEFGDTCSNYEKPCAFPRSTCSSGVCACTDGAANEDNACVIGLGSTCAQTPECGRNAECTSDEEGGAKTCQCAASFYEQTQADGAKRCVRNEETTLGERCTMKGVPCNFERSLCDPDGFCICNAESIPVDHDADHETAPVCKAKASGTCIAQSDCGLNAECRVDPDGAAKTCQCTSGFYLFNGQCVTNNGVIGTRCYFSNIPCSAARSICGPNRVCECAPGTVQEGNTCINLPGEVCEAKSDCLANGDCLYSSDVDSKVCVCAEGFFLNQGKCVKNTGQLGDRCEYNNQPCAFGHSSCANNVCSCDAETIEEDGACVLSLGTTCSNTNECLTNSDCAFSASLDTKLCQCSAGFFEQIDIGTGISRCVQNTGTKTGDICDFNGNPCAFERSSCNGGQCACAPGSFEKAGSCVLSLGRTCADSHDCLDNAECSYSEAKDTKICQCSETFFEFQDTVKNNTLCVRNNANLPGDHCEFNGLGCDFPRSVCAESQCECAPEALLSADNATCLVRAETEGCHVSEDCTENSHCLQVEEEAAKQCTCNLGHGAEEGKCVMRNSGTAYGTTCATPELSCAFENSLCLPSANICGCAAGYVRDGNDCVQPPNSDCAVTTDCGSSAFCASNGKCECFSGLFITVSGACVAPKGTGVHEVCDEANKPCNFPNSVCAPQEGATNLTCACNQDSVEQTGLCRIKAGKSCERTVDCTEFATCVEGTSNKVCRCIGEDGENGLCSSAISFGPLSALVVTLVSLLMLLK